MTVFEPSTLRLDKGDISLLQALTDTANDCPCLVQYSGDDTGKRHALVARLAVIGRLPEAEVYIDSPDIGRRHAELHMSGGATVLRDLGSINGTYLNGAAVTSAVELQDGDLIRLGRVVLKYFDRTNIEALLHDSMYRSAAIDAGTHAFCKRYLMQMLERALRLAQRSGRPLSLVCLDLDHFKDVNDRYGHNAGDLVLRGTAAALQRVLRPRDAFGRIGGEEFAVVLPDTPLAEAVDLAERLRAVVEATDFDLAVEPSGEPCGERAASATPPAGRPDVTVPRRRHAQTASFGVAQLHPGIADARSLLGAADEMLYAAKRGGRNRVAFCVPDTAVADPTGVASCALPSGVSLAALLDVTGDDTAR